MLQRIQTVYLIITAALFILLLFVPLATLQSGTNMYLFDITGLNVVNQQHELIIPTWSLFALNGIIIILALTIIFLYRKRVVQIRLSIFNTLLIIGFCALAGFYLWQFKNNTTIAANSDIRIIPSIWCACPLIALIFNYLAIRSIGIDEALVRSLERLR